MRRAGKRVHLRKDAAAGLGSCIEDGANISSNVRIGQFTYILSNAVIKKGCVVGNHCIIGHPSKLRLQKTDFSATSSKVSDLLVKASTTVIGEESIIRAGSIIYEHVFVGRKARMGHNVLIREHVTVGDNCVIGTQAILDGYIKMGNKSMVQSQCYITQSVRIGTGVFIAPGCIFLDNKKIVLGEGLRGPSIDDYARIGGGTKILPGVTVGKHALIGAGSVVTKDVPPKAIAYGNPAKVKGFLSNEEIEAYVNSIKTWE